MTPQPIPQPTPQPTPQVVSEPTTQSTIQPVEGGTAARTFGYRTSRPSLPRRCLRLRLRCAHLILGPVATPAPRARRHLDDRGSAAIEAVIGIAAFGLFIAMTVAGGRVALARQGVESAANAAARAASITRTSSEAAANARSAATDALDDQDIRCSSIGVRVDTSGFSAPVGAPAQVTATVSCTVTLSDLAVPGLPGYRTITETVSSPVDAYRERR